MKRLFLTISFTLYSLFVPFLMVNCSGAKDEPYSLDVNADSSASTALTECQSMEFLIEDCVDILQAENDRIEAEQVQIQAASLLLEDFTICQDYVASDSTAATSLIKMATSTSTSTSTATESDDLSACADTIASVVDAYQVCESLSSSDRYDECDDVIETVEDAVQLCDDDEDSVTADFCALVSA